MNEGDIGLERVADLKAENKRLKAEVERLKGSVDELRKQADQHPEAVRQAYEKGVNLTKEIMKEAFGMMQGRPSDK